MSASRRAKTAGEILSEKDKLRLNAEAEASLFDYNDYTRVEHWYQDVEPITFPTTFIPLSRAEAKAITKRFENSRSKRQARRFASQAGVRFDEEKNNISLEPELQAAYDQLLHRIDAGLASLLEGSQAGAFIKLSMRSPKDGAAQNKKTLAHLRQFLESTKPDHPEDEEEWSRRALVCYTRACSASLCIHSYVFSFFTLFDPASNIVAVLIILVFDCSQRRRGFRTVMFKSKDL